MTRKYEMFLGSARTMIEAVSAGTDPEVILQASLPERLAANQFNLNSQRFLAWYQANEGQMGDPRSSFEEWWMSTAHTSGLDPQDLEETWAHVQQAMGRGQQIEL